MFNSASNDVQFSKNMHQEPGGSRLKFERHVLTISTENLHVVNMALKTKGHRTLRIRSVFLAVVMAIFRLKSLFTSCSGLKLS